MYRSKGAPPAWGRPGQGTGWATMAWGEGEDRWPLHHSCLPNTVPLLTLRNCYLIYDKNHGQANEVREERKRGGQQKDIPTSYCSMNEVWGPFNCSLSSSMSSLSHPLSRQLPGNWSEAKEMPREWTEYKEACGAKCKSLGRGTRCRDRTGRCPAVGLQLKVAFK